MRKNFIIWKFRVTIVVADADQMFLTGTNLQALIDFTRDPMNFSAAEIVLVISNKHDVQGLRRAENAGIATKVGELP